MEILPQLSKHKLPILKEELRYRNKLSMPIWFCPFSVNQHDNICGSFAPGEPDIKRMDAVTGQIHPLCQCGTVKHFNDAGASCEINKFDDMLSFMCDECRKQFSDFCLIAVVDPAHDYFDRIWCMAELVQAKKMGMNVKMKFPTHVISPNDARKLRNIRIENCKATRQEDYENVLRNIGDDSQIRAFNQNLQEVFFGVEDVLHNWQRDAAFRDLANAMMNGGRNIRSAFNRAVDLCLFDLVSVCESTVFAEMEAARSRRARKKCYAQKPSHGMMLPAVRTLCRQGNTHIPNCMKNKVSHSQQSGRRGR